MQYLCGFRRQRCPKNSVTLTALWAEIPKRGVRKGNLSTKGDYDAIGYPLVLPG